MSRGIDVGTSQRNIIFTTARSLGYTSCYVKLGGDNVGRYVAPYYVALTDRARSVGMRMGHYWVPNANYDPVGAADYFVNNLRGWTSSDFAVLDNESLDGARLYSDQQAAHWVNRVRYRLGIPARQVKVYLGLSDARSHSWPALLATGCDFIIAAYSYAPFTFPAFASIPASRIKGHQYSSSGNIGGIITDLNDWKPDAFTYGGTATAGEVGTPVPVPATPTRRKKSMSTGYWTKRADGKVNWALAGDGVGRAAWINVPTQKEANELAVVHGSFVELSNSRFDGLKAYYLDDPMTIPAPVVNVPAPIVNIAAPEAVPVGDVSVTIDPAAFNLQPVVDALKALPAEMLAALKAAL